MNEPSAHTRTLQLTLAFALGGLAACNSQTIARSVPRSVGESGYGSVADWRLLLSGRHPDSEFVAIEESAVPGFAGWYLSPADTGAQIPVVRLRDLQYADEARAALRPILEGFRAQNAAVPGLESVTVDNIVFEHADYSITELAQWYPYARSVLGADASLADIDEVRNRLYIGATNVSAAARIREYLASTPVAPDAVIVDIAGPLTLASTGIDMTRLSDWRTLMRSRTPDQEFLEVAEGPLPGFAGWYLSPPGNGEQVPIVRLKHIEAADNARAVIEPMLDRFRNANAGVPGLERVSAENIRFETATYSIVELARWYPYVRILLGGYASLTDIDEMNNGLFVGARSDAAAEAIRQYLPTTPIPSGAVRIEVVGDIIPAATVRDNRRPTLGGLEIEAHPLDNYLCTMSFNATFTDAKGAHRGFVTATHCVGSFTADNNGVEVSQDQDFFGWNTAGKVIKDPPFVNGTGFNNCELGEKCRRSDSAFIEYYGTVSSTRGIAKTTATCAATVDCGNQIDVIGEFPIKGKTAITGNLVLRKLGRTTGANEGSIDNTCVDGGIAKESSSFVILCSTKVAALAKGGDSGGPVFTTPNNLGETTLAGTLYGIPSDGSTFYLFSRVSDIEADFGVTLDVVQ